MSYLGVSHHDASYRFLIHALCFLGALILLSCTACAEPDALPGISFPSHSDLDEESIKAFEASGVALVLENTQLTQQNTVTATLYGYPHSDYYVWFMDTSEMTGQYGDQPPQFSQNQNMVFHDPQNGPYLFGSYKYNQGRGASIQENVAGSPSHGVLYYAQVRTGSNGQASIAFSTSGGTKPGLYIIRAERFTQGQYEIAYAPIEVLEKQGGLSLITDKKIISTGEDIVLSFTGQPLKYYTIWVTNTDSMTGGPNNQPPLLLSEQENVWRDPASGPYEIGQYRCDTCRGTTLQQSVATQPDSGTRYYARVMTDKQGFGTVTFSSTQLIKPQKYTFRIEEPFVAVANAAEVTVLVKSTSTKSLSLSVSHASIMQGEPFYAEIWGLPKTAYYLWLLNTNTMDGSFGHQPPSIVQAQTLMNYDPVLGPYIIGNYQYDGGSGQPIRDNIAIDSEYRGTYYYGTIETDTSGYARVAFHTSAGTESKTYTIRAELPQLVGGDVGAEFVEANVRVETETGILTITPETEHIALGSSSHGIIAGLPNTEYYLWFYNTGHMSGHPGDQPPIFQTNPNQLQQDPSYGPYLIGNYGYADACCGRVIQNDVPSRPDSGVGYYGLVRTDEMGHATIGFNTQYMVTKPGNYQLHVERKTNDGYEKANTVITVGSIIPPSPNPRLTPVPTRTPAPTPTWPVQTSAPTWMPTPTPTPTPAPTWPVPTQISSLPVKLTLATDSNVLNPGEEAGITLFGQPLTEYFFWVFDTAHLSGDYGDQPLIIPSGQKGIYQDEIKNIIIGQHLIDGKGGMTIHKDVPLYPDNGIYYYALITTDQTGVAQLKVQAPDGVLPKKYTLRAEGTTGAGYPEVALTSITVTGHSQPEFPMDVQTMTPPLGILFPDHFVQGPEGASYSGNIGWESDKKNFKPPLGEVDSRFTLLPSGQNTFSLQLSPGWNFISIPGIPISGSDTFSIFSSVDTQERSIWTYDPVKWPVTQGWNMVHMNDPLQPLEGYWIYSAAFVTVPIPVSDIIPMGIESHIQTSIQSILAPTTLLQTPQTPVYAKQMHTGWNAIGLYGQHQRSAKDALASVSNDWTIVLGFDNTFQRYDTSIINGGSDEYADSRFMQPGTGYWLYMQNPGDLFG